MNAMGHDVPTMIGVDHRGVAKQITQLIPDYMVMGERGMKDMTEMEMPLPDNTAPMMAGQGPFGAVGMGGMFSVVKVRRDQPRGDYSDPGWYKHPPGDGGLRMDRRAARPGALQGRGHGLDAAAGPTRHSHRSQGAQACGRALRSLSIIHATQKGHAMQVSKRSLIIATAASLLTSAGRVLAHGDEKHPAKSRPGEEGTEGLGHRRRCAAGQAQHRRRHVRHHALHARPHRRQAGRNRALRGPQRRQANARVRHRHQGRERRSMPR